ncbi:MAG: S41 family peptidase [Elusimicrobia bacterium]|nr:S41 family peptidase [Elusimicrobiota bacterium]
MKKIVLSLTISFFAFCAAFAQTETNWAQTAVTDLDYMYQMYRDNHGGAADPDNPGFKKKLDKEYKHARGLALKAKTEYDYQKALVSLLAPFKDVHMRVDFNNKIYPYTFKRVVDETLRHPTSVESFGGNNAWIYMNTFESSDRTCRDIFEAYSKLAPELEKLKNKDIIVLDLRYNVGGCFGIGDIILSALYGEKYVDAAKNNSYHSAIHYLRATPWVAQSMADTGDSVENVNTMKQAIKDGQPYMEGWKGSGVLTSLPATDLKARVYVLTDQYCVSACLNFMDTVKETNAVQIGRETNKDTRYVRGNRAALPSGLGRIIIAYERISGRYRKDNEAYKPDYKFKDDMNDTVALQNWILELDKKINKNK